MSDVKLGKILNGTEPRDAIHVAIAPVTAASQLTPGQHVGFVEGHAVGPCARPIGIVDPFLDGVVRPGARFYLFIYPNTVTSLRHEWTHPAFSDSQTESEAWLRELASECGLSYERLMADIPTGRVFTGDREMYGCREGADVRLHFKNVTGIDVGEDVYFSCAC